MTLADEVKRAFVVALGPSRELSDVRRAYDRALSEASREGLIEPASADRVASLAQEALAANRRLASRTRDRREQERLAYEWEGLASRLRAARSVGGYGTDGGGSGVREPRRPRPVSPTAAAGRST